MPTSLLHDISILPIILFQFPYMMFVQFQPFLVLMTVVTDRNDVLITNLEAVIIELNPSEFAFFGVGGKELLVYFSCFDFILFLLVLSILFTCPFMAMGLCECD